MEHKIPTLYSNYDEAMLDIDIFGRKVLSPHLSISELRDRLFEDFKRSKPLPTLTSRRYELSRLVSEDYKILYTKKLELKTNEQLINLKENNSSKKEFNFNFDNLEPIANNIRSMFTYESRSNDSDRERIMQKYDLYSGEEFSRGIAETEKLFGSIEEDTSLIKTDDEIDAMGLEQDEKVTVYEETPKFEYTANSLDSEEEDDDYPDFEDEDDDYTDSEDNISEDEDDDDYPDFDDEEDDYPTFDEEDEDYSTLDEEDEDYSTLDEEDEDLSTLDEEDEDLSALDEEDEDLSEDDDYPDFKEDSSKDDTDYPNFEDDDEDEDYPTFEDEDEDDSIVNAQVSNELSTGTQVDEDFSDFDMEFEEEPLVIPKTPAQLNIIKPVEEKVDKSLEPTDLRQFLRKHPRSSMEYVSKYFTKKQINDALKSGRIIKKGNILRLP